jgi:hypothetical protein
MFGSEHGLENPPIQMMNVIIKAPITLSPSKGAIAGFR